MNEFDIANEITSVKERDSSPAGNSPRNCCIHNSLGDIEGLKEVVPNRVVYEAIKRSLGVGMEDANVWV
jgi:hypothetical protein